MKKRARTWRYKYEEAFCQIDKNLQRIQKYAKLPTNIP